MRFGAVLIVFVALLLSGCNHNQRLAPKSYIQWVHNPDHGMKKEKAFDEVTFGLMYRPAEYVILQEKWKGLDSDIDTTEWTPRVSALKDQLNFHFRIQSNNQVHPLEMEGRHKEYFNRLQYYLTSAQGDFMLVADEQDTLECKLYHYERNYGAAPVMDMLVTFERPKNWQNEIQFIYNDPLLGIGKINFTYDQDEINSIPSLAL